MGRLQVLGAAAALAPLLAAFPQAGRADSPPTSGGDENTVKGKVARVDGENHRLVRD